MNRKNKYDIPTNGYITSFSIFNLPILIHWTFPAGGAFIAFTLGDQTIAKFLALVLAFTLMIIIHELGHALATKMFSCKVIGIFVTGDGGWCFIENEPKTFAGRILFYGGGIIAQLLLLLLTIILLIMFGKPESIITKSFTLTFTIVNLLIMVVNIIPSTGNDGMKLLNEIKKESLIKSNYPFNHFATSIAK